MAIPVRGMAPLLQVFDMATALKFYCDVLEFEVVMTDGKPPSNCDWVLLRLQGIELMLNTAYEAPDRPPAPVPARAAAHDDTCLFFSTPDVDGAYRSLREKGLNLKEPRVAPYGMKQLWLKDPDGYGLCFQWRAT
jgi:glyoxylase I family protein